MRDILPPFTVKYECNKEKKYSTYDLEFLEAIQALKPSKHYLSYTELVLDTDHKALEYRKFQDKSQL